MAQSDLPCSSVHWRRRTRGRQIEHDLRPRGASANRRLESADATSRPSRTGDARTWLEMLSLRVDTELLEGRSLTGNVDARPRAWQRAGPRTRGRRRQPACDRHNRAWTLPRRRRDRPHARVSPSPLSSDVAHFELSTSHSNASGVRSLQRLRSPRLSARARMLRAGRAPCVARARRCAPPPGRRPAVGRRRQRAVAEYSAPARSLGCSKRGSDGEKGGDDGRIEVGSGRPARLVRRLARARPSGSCASSSSR